MVVLSSPTYSNTTQAIEADELVITGDLSVANSDITFTATQPITFDNLLVDGGSLTFNNASPITVTGTVNLLNGATLTASEAVNVGGNMNVFSGSTVTIPDSTSTEIYDLDLSVAAVYRWMRPRVLMCQRKVTWHSLVVRILVESFIFTTSTWDVKQAGCHGGTPRFNSNFTQPYDCSYGNYWNARFAGSGGFFNGTGGGLARIAANSLLLDGAILANAKKLQARMRVLAVECILM